MRTAVESGMSRTTIAGLLVGISLFAGAILMATDNYLMFLSGTSMLLVVGGTLANAFISYQGRYVIAALKEVPRIYGHAVLNEGMTYDQSRKVIEWARIVQTKGALALERQIQQHDPDDHFMHYGIHLVVDGFKPVVVRELLTNSYHSAYDRAMRQVDVLRNMAGSAPAFGMIGTLIGLVIMLDGLGEGEGAEAAAKLGKGLSVALLTTLYGVVLARFIFQPSADKTQQRQELIKFRNFLMMEGFVMLSEGRTVGYVKERINSFLDPSIVAQMDGTPVGKSGAGGGGKAQGTGGGKGQGTGGGKPGGARGPGGPGGAGPGPGAGKPATGGTAG